MNLLENYKNYLLDLEIKNINSRLSVAKNFIKYLNNRTITEKLINNFCTNSTRKSIIKYLLIANNIYIKKESNITDSKYADITKFLENNNFSENTIKTYKYRLEKFLDYIGGTEAITETKIKDFLKYKKYNEQKNYIAVLKMYLNLDINIDFNNTTKNKKIKNELTESEIYKLIQYINNLDNNNFLELNLKTCLIFALFSGFKITEFQKLNLCDLKIKENNILKIKYNNKEKIILNTNNIFINHITELNNIFENKDLPLIRTISKRRITSNTIHKKISKVLKELNINNKL